MNYCLRPGCGGRLLRDADGEVRCHLCARSPVVEDNHRRCWDCNDVIHPESYYNRCYSCRVGYRGKRRPTSKGVRL